MSASRYRVESTERKDATEVLEIDASNLLAMRGLERVYMSTQQWSDLVRVLEMQLDVVTTERERIDVLMKIAQIQEEQFLKPDLAATRLEQIVEIDSELVRILRIECVLDVDKCSQSAALLRLGDDRKGEGGLAGGFRAENFHDATARNAADAEGAIN